MKRDTYLRELETIIDDFTDMISSDSLAKEPSLTVDGMKKRLIEMEEEASSRIKEIKGLKEELRRCSNYDSIQRDLKLKHMECSTYEREVKALRVRQGDLESKYRELQTGATTSKEQMEYVVTKLKSDNSNLVKDCEAYKQQYNNYREAKGELQSKLEYNLAQVIQQRDQAVEQSKKLLEEKNQTNKLLQEREDKIVSLEDFLSKKQADIASFKRSDIDQRLLNENQELRKKLAEMERDFMRGNQTQDSRRRSLEDYISTLKQDLLRATVDANELSMLRTVNGQITTVLKKHIPSIVNTDPTHLDLALSSLLKNFSNKENKAERNALAEKNRQLELTVARLNSTIRGYESAKPSQVQNTGDPCPSCLEYSVNLTEAKQKVATLQASELEYKNHLQDMKHIEKERNVFSKDLDAQRQENSKLREKLVSMPSGDSVKERNLRDERDLLQDEVEALKNEHRDVLTNVRRVVACIFGWNMVVDFDYCSTSNVTLECIYTPINEDDHIILKGVTEAWMSSFLNDRTTEAGAPPPPVVETQSARFRNVMHEHRQYLEKNRGARRGFIPILMGFFVQQEFEASV